jgi:hypothetical protein
LHTFLRKKVAVLVREFPLPSERDNAAGTAASPVTGISSPGYLKSLPS